MKKAIRRVLGFLLAMVIGQFAGAGIAQVAAEETGNGTWEATPYFTNGDFETGSYDGWNITYTSWDNAGYKVKTDSYASNNTSQMFNFWNGSASNTMTFSRTITAVPAGTYHVKFDVEGMAGTSGLAVTVADLSAQTLPATTGWDAWQTVTTGEFALTEAGDVTLTISGEVPGGYWGDFDNFVLEQLVPAAEDTEEPSETASETVTESETESESESESETETETEEALVYNVEITADNTSVKAGETVSLTAKVTKNGEEITDLEAAGLYLWWWTDTWNDHTDGNSDAIYSNYDANSGYSLTADVTLKSVGNYYIVAELQDADSASLAKNFVTLASADPNTFTVSDDNYTVAVTVDNLTPETGDTVKMTAKVTKADGTEVTDLAAEGLSIWWWTDTWAEGHGNGLTDAAYSNYDNNSGNSFTADVTLPSAGTYYITAQLQGTGVDLKNYIGVTTTASETDTAITGEITVEKVKDLPADFAMGMDISSIMSEFASGVTYKDFEGNTIDNISDFCKFIAANGITHVRVRVWVDPFDANGNGYGGGNNDVAAAAAIAEGCRAAGIHMLVDFHCSDFWADPGKQQAPKAWASYSLEQKEEAVYNHILSGLNTIDPNCETVDMVQVGNETTGSFAGVSGTANMCALFSAGAEAVRAYNNDVKVVIHITNPEKGNVTKWAKNLADNAVDYDVLATSYYPYWHGTFENLASELKAVKDTYGKEAMVAETSYAFTLEDTDGHENTVRVGNNDSGMAYPFSVQGQASYMRDVIDVVNSAGGIGVFYWESAWITVGDTTGLEGADLEAQIEANKAIWEANGSGWASSFAAEYDAADAGKWFGGSAVDNQAMFYADGTPTAAMYVWNYVKTGAVSKYTTVESIETLAGEIDANATVTLPTTVNVTYNSGTVAEPVAWNISDMQAVNVSVAGVYEIRGTVTFSKTVDAGSYAGKAETEVVYTLTVKQPNLITDANDAGFESGVNFVIEGSGISAIPAKDDPYAGNGSMHWYSKTAATGMVTYNKAISLEAGKYNFEAKAQGYAGDTVTLEILDAEGNLLAAGNPTVLQGWAVWQTPSVSFEITETTDIKVRITVGIQATGWGTVDALYLYRTGDVIIPSPEPELPGNIGNAPSVQDNGNVTEAVISSGDSAYRVLTSQQMQGVEVVADADVIPSGADFTISQPADGTPNYEKAEAAVRNYLKGHRGFLVYEMSLTDANGAAIEQLKDYINVTIPIPAALTLGENEAYVVYRVEDNGKLTRCVTAWADGRITFATNHFSTYVLAVEPVSGVSPKTADASLAGVACMLMLFTISAATAAFFSKRRYY